MAATARKLVSVLSFSHPYSHSRSITNEFFFVQIRPTLHYNFIASDLEEEEEEGQWWNMSVMEKKETENDGWIWRGIGSAVTKGERKETCALVDCSKLLASTRLSFMCLLPRLFLLSFLVVVFPIRQECCSFVTCFVCCLLLLLSWFIHILLGSYATPFCTHVYFFNPISSPLSKFLLCW